MAHQPNCHQNVLQRNKENTLPESFMKGVWENVRKNSSQPGKVQQLGSCLASGVSSAAWKDLQDSETPTGNFGHVQSRQRRTSPPTPTKSIYVSETSVGLDETKPRQLATNLQRNQFGDTKKVAGGQRDHIVPRPVLEDKISILEALNDEQPWQRAGVAGTEVEKRQRALSTDPVGSPQTRAAPGLKTQDQTSSHNEERALFQVRIDHLQSCVAKKDLEIAVLKRKLSEQQKLMRGFKVCEGGEQAMALEIHRLRENLARLQEILREGGSAEPGVLGLLYDVDDLGYVGSNQTTPASPRGASRGRTISRDRIEGKDRGRSKSKEHIVRPCTWMNSQWTKNNNVHEIKSQKPAFSFEELANWVPKTVHTAVKTLSGTLSLDLEQEKILKSFIISLNQSFVQKERTALESCVQLCQKEIRTLKKQLVSTELMQAKTPVRHKTDRQAFMEGASWILTRVRGQFKKMSVLMDSVLNDLDCSPKVLMKALVFATEGLGKLHKKLEKYKDHIDLEQSKESRKAAQNPKYTSIAPKTPDTALNAETPSGAKPSRQNLLRAQSTFDRSSQQKRLQRSPEPVPWQPFDAQQAEREALSLCLDSDSEDASVSF